MLTTFTPLSPSPPHNLARTHLERELELGLKVGLKLLLLSDPPDARELVEVDEAVFVQVDRSDDVLQLAVGRIVP